MAEHETCPCEAVVQLKEIVSKHDEMISRHTERLARGDTDFALLHQDMTRVENTIKENTVILQKLVEKPGNRYDSLVDQGFKIILTVLLTYIAVKLGLQ